MNRHESHCAKDIEDSQKGEPLFDKFYKLAWGDRFHDVVSLSGSMEAQDKGIDRIVIDAAGDVHKIDEKLRGAHYDDIALEWKHSDSYDVGWVEKDLEIDLIAYAFQYSVQV